VYYQATIATPPNTAEVDALATRLQVAKGVITSITVGMAPGCAGLCHIQIRDKGWQIVPWTPHENLAWDDYVFDLPNRYALETAPFDLTVLSWNEDDTYAHTVFVGVNVDEGEIGPRQLEQKYAWL